jgi:WD40 repeat protein
MWRAQVTRGGVYSLAFSPDSATVYTGDGGGWVSAWDRAKGTQRKLFQLQGRYGSEILRLAVTRDGKRILAATHSSFKVWDAEAGTFWPAREVPARNDGFALADDDRTAAAVKGGRSIVFWDLIARGPHPARPEVRLADEVIDLTFCPADSTLAAADMDGGLYLIEPDAVQPVRINTAADQAVVYSDWCRYLDFSVDGRTLAVGGDRSILLWDVPSRRLRRTIKAGRAIVRQLAFHPGGKLLASGADTPVVALWDAATGKAVNRFDWGLGSKVLSLAFAPDGMTAAAGGSNRTFVLWDLADQP